MTNEAKKPLVQPLTLAQLEQMEGQPVYIQILQTGEGRWGLLKALGEYVAEILMPDGKTSYHLIDLYGKTWTAYAYPPAHIDREAWMAEWKRQYKIGISAKPGYVCSSCDMWHERPSWFCPACGRAMTPEAWAELEKRIGGDTE